MTEQKSSFESWREPPAVLRLDEHEAHVWLLRDDTAMDLPLSILSADEQARAERLDSEMRRRFTATRAVLRFLLARYTGTDPSTISFAYGPLGKPRLPRGAPHFSVSHSGDRSILAFTAMGEIGVDIERVRDGRRFAALAARFFAPSTNALLGATQWSSLPQVFTEAWCQREAFVKAVGGGLYATADLLPFHPGLLRLEQVSVGDDAWTVAPVDAGDGYACRVVARGDITRLDRLLVTRAAVTQT